MGSGSESGGPRTKRTKIGERVLGGRSGCPKSSCLAPLRELLDPSTRASGDSFQQVARSKSETFFIPFFWSSHVNGDSCLLSQRALHHGVDRANLVRSCSNVDVIQNCKEELTSPQTTVGRAARDRTRGASWHRLVPHLHLVGLSA